MGPTTNGESDITATHHSRKTGIWSRVWSEIGLSALTHCARDVKILIVQRFIRLFAYAGSTLVLALYLAELGNSEAKIGLFMTLTLIGDLVLSLLFTLIADRMGRRNVLILGSVSIVGSGVIFGLIDNFWVLLLGATIGVISPTANEIGPFRAVEESIIAHLTPTSERNNVYSWYSLIGIIGQAVGTLFCGWLIEFLMLKRNFSTVQAYRVIFFGYAIIGIVKLGLTIILSSKCEIDKGKALASSQDISERDERTPLLSEQVNGQTKTKKFLGFPVTKESLTVLAEVSLLSFVEAIAIGLVVVSWIAYFYNEKFAIDEGHLGLIFFISYILGALSNIVAPLIARRLGTVKTIAFASLGSGLFIALIPVPKSALPAVLFWQLRMATNVIGLRSAFVASMFLPAERTAFMGFINVVRTCGNSIGPLITGEVAGTHLFWLAFVLAGGTHAAYTTGLLVLFGDEKTREEKAKKKPVVEEDGDDERDGRAGE